MPSNELSKQPISFQKSLLAALPFANGAKKTRKKVDNLSFFKYEKKRIVMIQHLVDEGKHDLALKELLKDTDSDCGLQYYNRIRYEEKNCKVDSNNDREMSNLPSASDTSKERVS